MGCGTRAPSPPATSARPNGIAKSVGIAGEALAAVALHDGSLDAPGSWVPEVAGIFPSRASELSEVWAFSLGRHCRFASYTRSVADLHAEHPKWTELASSFAKDSELREAKTTAPSEHGDLLLQLRVRPLNGPPGASLAVCTPLRTPDRAAIAAALIERIPSLRGHGELLRPGFVSSVDYTRRVLDGRAAASVDVWLVGDEAARTEWLELLWRKGLVEGKTFQSIAVERGYDVTPRDKYWELHVRGE